MLYKAGARQSGMYGLVWIWHKERMRSSVGECVPAMLNMVLVGIGFLTASCSAKCCKVMCRGEFGVSAPYKILGVTR